MAFSPSPPPNALSIDQSASLAGVTRRTVERWAASGALRFSYFGRRRYTTRDDLDRFLRMGPRYEPENGRR